MKILRVRRGFSTNCSGANEYFPPQPLAPPTDGGAGDAALSPWTPNPNAKVVFRWVTFMPDGAPPPMLREALRANESSSDGGSRDAGAGDGAMVAIPRRVSETTADAATTSVSDIRTPPPAAAESSRGTGSFGLILFVVMIGVLALFGVERLIRRLRPGSQKGSHGDDGAP